MAVSVAGTRFIGRTAELGILRDQIARSRLGQGVLTLITGDPGIGKSRLLLHLADEAQNEGVEVFWGRCFAGEGTPAFWPWIQILRSYLRGHDPGELAEELGPDCALLGTLDLTLRQQLAAIPAASVAAIPEARSLEPQQARFRLFDAIATWLANVVQRRPLLLVFDDLHWSDAPSIELLRFVSRSLGNSHPLLIGTYRDTEVNTAVPLRLLAAEAAQAGVGRVLALHGLSESESAGFLGEQIGFAAPPGLVRTVHAWTEGNPFFMSEVMRLLAADGRDGMVSDAGERTSLPLPASLRDVVALRLEHLPTDCLRVLAMAAVAGREFGLATLRRVSGFGATSLLELLDRATRGAVITPVLGALGRYRFAHAVLREVLYAQLGSTERIALHRQVGQAFEELYALDLEPHLAELAHHFAAAAGSLEGVEPAVTYAARAAHYAIGQMAYEEAARLYRLALEVLDLAGVADEPRRYDLFLALADAQTRAGALPAAAAAAEQALALARRLADPLRLARAVLALGERWGDDYGRHNEDELALLQEALDQLADGPIAIRAQLMVRMGRLLMFGGQCAPAVAISRAAVALARAAQDASTLLHVLARAQWQLIVEDSPGERLAMAHEVLSLAREQRSPSMMLEGHQYRLCAALEAGDIAMVDAELDAYTQLAATLRQPLYLWMADSYRAMRALLAGRFAEAEELARSAAATAGTELADAGQVLAAQVGLSWWFRGRASEMIERTRTLCRRHPGVASWRAMLALLYCEVGALAEARAELDRLAADGFRSVPRDTGWWAALSCLAEVCSCLRARDAAEQLYALLLPHDGRVLVGPWSVFCLAPASYYLALLAGAAERYEAAERHFATADRTIRALGARPFHARLLSARATLFGQLAHVAGEADRLAAARSMAAEARTLAGDLGMERVREQADVLLHSLDAGRAGEHDTLTLREREVLRLLASGRSNREIAEELVLSVNTVTRHLANIYGKLELRSRSEATVYAFHHGLA